MDEEDPSDSDSASCSNGDSNDEDISTESDSDKDLDAPAAPEPPPAPVADKTLPGVTLNYGKIPFCTSDACPMRRGAIPGSYYKELEGCPVPNRPCRT